MMHCHPHCRKTCIIGNHLVVGIIQPTTKAKILVDPKRIIRLENCRDRFNINPPKDLIIS